MFLLVDDTSESSSLALLVLYTVPLPIDVEFVILLAVGVDRNFVL